MANAITVFVKEVIRLCSRVFINFLFFGANLPGGIKPNLIYRIPVPGIA